MLKKYKLGFDIWGALLFLIIMVPNFIWFVVPAPNDILRVDSITKTLDTVASVCQVLMIIVLCILINREPDDYCIMHINKHRTKKAKAFTINNFCNNQLLNIFYKLGILLCRKH